MTFLAVLCGAVLLACTAAQRTPISIATSGSDNAVIPFENIARDALGDKAYVNNWHPGVALFDYDRDGDLDFYVTAAEGNALKSEVAGGPNMLFRNNGDGTFTDVAEQAGVAAFDSNSSAIAACDFNNDGYQDLYVASYGRIGDELDYRSVATTPGLREVVVDRLFLNRRDGTFEDFTEAAFGDSANIRSAISVACADVNGDGWIDVFVGNRADQDFIRFDDPRHHGHYNVLYRNNGDLTFTDVTEGAGLIGPQIVMRALDGSPMVWQDPKTGARTEGYDPEITDAKGNKVGDPTGQTLATLFFDHDNDRDPDLWLADDGDRLKVYRNDSTRERIQFTPIGKPMAVDKVGAWMGFAVGDYDGDADLDLFITNIGFHPLLSEPPRTPSGDCAYAHQFAYGTCFHFLLRNDGIQELAVGGIIGRFHDVAPTTAVRPSRALPPLSLDPETILPAWQVPTGLAAYDFGFGTVFFDLENDGDQDLYWLGSMGGRGEGPNGLMYQGAGRMLRGDGNGSFDDVTVESHLLDIQGVDYSVIDATDPAFDAERQRLHTRFHENGKGLAKGDLNGDGYVDLIGTNSSGPVFLAPGVIDIFGGPLMVWINGGGTKNWITLRLKGRMAIDGTGSNADGVGARVYLKAKANRGVSRTQVQDVLASSTFLSMNSLELNFGLGNAAEVDKITIQWPSGVVQVLSNVKINQILDITEPEARDAGG